MGWRLIPLIVISYFLWSQILTTSAHHNTYLPLVPNTPLMRSIEQTQGGPVRWCVNSRAAGYPNFVNQVREVHEEYKLRTSIDHQQVSFGTTCQIQHVMPDNTNCSGCAARVFYWYPQVLIEYKWQLGFSLWYSTIAHELGHAMLGLHEQYVDLGNIGCTRRTDTVMDCGSFITSPPRGIYFPTASDVVDGCALYGSWCGVLANDPRGPQEVVGRDGVTVIRWSACNSLDQRFTSSIRYHYADGTTSNGVWEPGGSVVGFSSRTGFTRVPTC